MDNTLYSQALQNLVQNGATNFAADPSYQNRFQGGQQALLRQQAAGGFYGSGNMGTALVDYGQKAASDEYQAQFDRLKGIVNQPYETEAMGLQNQMLERANTQSQQAFNREQYNLEQQANKPILSGQINNWVPGGIGGGYSNKGSTLTLTDPSKASTQQLGGLSYDEYILQQRKKLGLA